MKRLVVNAFCPGDKVISRHAAKPAGEAARLWPAQSNCRRVAQLRSWLGKHGGFYWRRLVKQGWQASSVLAIYIKIREVRTAFADKFGHFGLWLSLVERLVRDQEAVGSNPTSPIRCGKCNSACVKQRNPQKTGVWHKRPHTVIVEIRLFPCIPLPRS